MSQDVDLRLVERINIMNINFRSLKTHEVFTINYRLSYSHGSTQGLITLVGLVDELNVRASTSLNEDLFLEAIEEAVVKVEGGESNYRLEDTEYFSAAMWKVYDLLIEELSKRNNHLYFTDTDKIYLENSLGLILNEEKNEPIGTFESFEVREYRKTNTEVEPYFIADHLIGLNLEEEISKCNEISFIFYDLKNEKEYKTIASSSDITIATSDALYAEGTNFSTTVKDFNSKSFRYELVKEQSKLLLSEFFKGNLGDLNYLPFRDKRLKVIKDVRERNRKERIFNEFSDIEI